MSLKGLEIAEKTADELSKVLRKDLSQLTEATADQIVKLRYLLNENENAFRRPADPAVLSRIRKLLTETDKQYLELLQNPTANSRLFTDRYARQLSQALSQKQALLLESELKFQQFKIRQMKTQLDRQTEILNESRLRQAHADALRAGGLVPEQYDRLTAQDVVTMHTKKAGSKTLGEYMENLYNEYGLVYRQSYIDAMAGQKSEKEIIRRMRQQSDVTAGKAALIVRTEANAIFNDQIARQIMENPLIAGYRFRATLDRRTSDICQKIDGKYFDKKELKPGVNFPPLHPNCRSTVETVMVYDLDAQKERIARGKNDEWLTVPGGTNYEDFKRMLNNDTRTRGTAQETGQNPAAQTQIDNDLAQRIEKQETALAAEFEKERLAELQKTLAIQTKEAAEVVDRIFTQQQYYPVDELKQLPVVDQMEERVKEADLKYGRTIDIRTPEREADRLKWEQQFLRMGSARKNTEGTYVFDGEIARNKQLDIILGLPAAGKSTRIANPLSAEKKAFIFDSDEVKQLIPEFKENGAAANAVHKESQLIQQRAMDVFTKGARKGDNIVLPIIGDDADSVYRKYVRDFKAAGYDITVHLRKADTEGSLNRVVARGLKEGRIIPWEVASSYQEENIENSFRRLVEEFGLKQGRIE